MAALHRKATSNPAVLVRAETTLPEGTEVITHYWIGDAGLEKGHSHASVEHGVLPFFIDVPDCSPGWADSWQGKWFTVEFEPPGHLDQRVAQTYRWPANVCG